MAKKTTTKFTPRDLEILTALDRTPLTPAQLLKLSGTFATPFYSEDKVRRRLRNLAAADLVRCFPYALITGGRAPSYWKLTRTGYRLLRDDELPLPHRRYFEASAPGMATHQFALAETIVQLCVAAHARGFVMRHFAREGSVKLTAGEFTLFPDACFQLAEAHDDQARPYNFVLELDNGTERIASSRDDESIERKIRGYEQHQERYEALHPARYKVLFVTTRSPLRAAHILKRVDEVQQNRERTIFLAAGLDDVQSGNPLTAPLFSCHRGLKRTLLPLKLKQKEVDDKQPQTVVASRSCRSAMA